VRPRADERDDDDGARNKACTFCMRVRRVARAVVVVAFVVASRTPSAQSKSSIRNHFDQSNAGARVNE